MFTCILLIISIQKRMGKAWRSPLHNSTSDASKTCSNSHAATIERNEPRMMSKRSLTQDKHLTPNEEPMRSGQRFSVKKTRKLSANQRILRAINKEYLCAADVAALACVKSEKVYQALKYGLIPGAVRIGHWHKITRDQVYHWVALGCPYRAGDA
jgi:hypothetical protein